MHYKDIEIFLELVRTRNITKTAEHLYVSQSTISIRLKNLEDEIGCQLIVRAKGRRTIQLTRQGELFIPVAERWRNLFEETELMKSASLSTLRLASNESTYYEIVAPFLLLFFQRHPDFKVAVQVCDSEEIYDMLEKNLVDYGFASYEAVHPEIQVKCIDRQPICVIQYAENPQPECFIRPDQLDPAKEICFTGGHFSSMSLWREKWFGLNRMCRLEVNTSRGIVPFMKHSDLWALSPLDMAKHLSEELSLQIYRLEEEPEPWKIYFLKKRKHYQSSLEIRRLFENDLADFLDARSQNSAIHP